MESLLANFDIENPKNFWKLYSSWKTPRVLNELYKLDKTSNKTKSSMLMWAIVHMFDKTENNPYRIVDSEERIGVINDDILSDPNFKWDDYKEVVDTVRILMTTELERSRDNLVEYMEKRRKFISEQQENLDFDTIANIDKTIKENKNLLAELDRLNAAIELSDESGVTKGGKIESLNETGMLRQ